MSNQKQQWTKDSIEELRKMWTNGDNIHAIAKHFGRSAKSVERALFRNSIQRPATHESTIEQDIGASADLYWKARYKELSRKYDKLLDQRTVIDVLASNIRELAPKSYDPAPSLLPQIQARETSGERQHAVLHLSDSHIGQFVHKNQTLTFGNYGFDVFCDRAAYLEQAVTSICTEHVNTKLPVLHLCWGGDLLHGDLNHANEAAHVLPLFSQYYAGAHVLAQLTRNLAALFVEVHCHGVVGNHTRWANQRKMPTVNRFSNLDMFAMALVEALTRDVPNVHWDLSTEPFAEFDVLGYSHRLEHGDHLKGGDRALGIPAHAFGRELSAVSQLYAKHERSPINYFLVGHLHRPMEFPHANGEILVNGGWPGIDEYALTNNFNAAPPQQRLYFVHPKFGRTANYYLSLAHAKTGCGQQHFSLNGLAKELTQ
jgi:hypothetical protein